MKSEYACENAFFQGQHWINDSRNTNELCIKISWLNAMQLDQIEKFYLEVKSSDGVKLFSQCHYASL